MAAASLLVVCGALAAPPGHARAQSAAAAIQRLWYQAYDQGVRAATAGNWALAIPALEAAKRGGPAPGRRVLFQGDRVDVFNPDYYLGLAYNATRRFAEAEAAFARVSESGLVREGDREFQELRRQAARATYERAVVEAERAADTGQYAEAEKTLQSVVGTLAGDDRAGKLVARVRELSAAARARDTAVTAQVNTPPDVSPVTPDTTVAGTEPGSKAPDTNIYEPPPGPAPTGIPAGTTATVVDPVRPGPRPAVDVARAELDGTTAYLSGDYEAAVTVLRPAAAAPASSPRVAFYLACSVVARAALTGRVDQPTLDEARRLFNAAAGDSARFTADRAFISPVVLRLLGSTASTTAGRAATAS